MRPFLKVYLLDDGDERFFGEGPLRLLRAVEETGSLRAAAQQMNMSYAKAFRLVRHAEEALGFPLTERSVGGSHGGGSRLTEPAKAFLRRYEGYKAACGDANRRIYQAFFGS